MKTFENILAVLTYIIAIGTFALLVIFDYKGVIIVTIATVIITLLAIGFINRKRQKWHKS